LNFFLRFSGDLVSVLKAKIWYFTNIFNFFWDRGDREPINHRFCSFHRKFSLNKMTGGRFEPPTFGAESLKIEP
jgi:hypothetical protein